MEAGEAVLFKGVGQDYASAHAAPDGAAVRYTPGMSVTAADWAPTAVCGAGLHLSPTPRHTHAYCDPKRYVAVAVNVADVLPIPGTGVPDKVKVPACRVLYEVNADGEPIGAEVAA